jgi:hypothetical protein
MRLVVHEPDTASGLLVKVWARLLESAGSRDWSPLAAVNERKEASAE